MTIIDDYLAEIEELQAQLAERDAECARLRAALTEIKNAVVDSRYWTLMAVSISRIRIANIADEACGLGSSTSLRQSVRVGEGKPADPSSRTVSDPAGTAPTTGGEHG